MYTAQVNYGVFTVLSFFPAHGKTQVCTMV